MRLQYIFHGKGNKQHPFYVKSTWEPPVQQSVALETFLEEVKFKLANTPIRRPKDNLSPGERRSPHVREFRRVLDSGLHTVDSGFQLSGFRIPKRAGFQIFVCVCFNVFLRISFSCSNRAVLKNVVRKQNKSVFFFDLQIIKLWD